MPVAALISGMMTLIASSPNMIIESSLRGRCLAPLDFFSWTPFGLAVLAAAIAFMLAARGLLSKQITAKDAAAISPTAYILRQRVAYELGFPAAEPEIVFKFRHDDMQKVAAARCGRLTTGPSWPQSPRPGVRSSSMKAGAAAV